MLNTNYFDSTKIISGAAMVLQSPRGVTLPTVSPLASPPPSATSFAVSPTDAAKLRPGDRLQLASATPTFLADELATLAVVKSISSDASPIITLEGAGLGSSPASGSASVRKLWNNRGATDGGVELSVANQTKDQEVDQSRVPVDATDQGMQVMLKAPMAEATLSNFAMAAGLADPTSPDELKINSTDAGVFSRFAFIGPAPSGKTRYAVINKGKSGGTSTHKADKENKPIYALEVKGYADTSMNPDTLHIKDV